MIPVAVHAHKIPLPLLADFPRRRIDINPFLDCGLKKRSFGEVDAGELAQRYPFARASPLMLFFDCHTINNISISGLADWDGEIHLYIGDTQHGDLAGFRKLQSLACEPAISRLVFVNNPHHAHWFRSDATKLKAYVFLPLGIANAEIDSDYPCSHVESRIVHAGSVDAAHPRRFRYFEWTTQHVYPDLITWMKTPHFRAANKIYATSRAALNISLNADLSFRVFEILRAGGICISDRLGRIQRDHCPYLSESNFYEFDGAGDLLSLLVALRADPEQFRKAHFPLGGLSDGTLGDLQAWSVPISDVRDPFRESSTDEEKRRRLVHYLAVRDLHCNLEMPMISVEVRDDYEFNHFLDLLDLPRLQIRVQASGDFRARVMSLQGEFKEMKIEVS